MGTKTTRLDLSKPGENDYYNQQTEQADNWQKVDDYAVYTDIDKNAIWGGEYGGYIQDTSITKVVGKRYIDQIDKKAYICKVAGSHVNTTANYEECNVVRNLERAKAEIYGNSVGGDGWFYNRLSGILTLYGTLKLPIVEAVGGAVYDLKEELGNLGVNVSGLKGFDAGMNIQLTIKKRNDNYDIDNVFTLTADKINATSIVINYGMPNFKSGELLVSYSVEGYAKSNQGDY